MIKKSGIRIAFRDIWIAYFIIFFLIIIFVSTTEKKYSEMKKNIETFDENQQFIWEIFENHRHEGIYGRIKNENIQ